MKISFIKLLFVINNFVINNFVNCFNNKPVETISIGQLINDIEDHNINDIYFSNDLSKIYTNDNFKRVAVSNPILTDRILNMAHKNNVQSTILEIPTNYLMQSVNTFFDFLFVSTIILVIIKSMNRYNIPFLKKSLDNRVKLNISLSSWAGSPEIFEECAEIVSYLKNSTNYKNVGANIPKGILLEGPPGTGKTLLARAIASEANANFISVSGSEFVEIFVGTGALKVRNLFKTARENSPSIIFIDEIDAIGKQRSTGLNMGDDEREQTLNQILAEMDGFTPNENIIVLGATNRKDVLDSALLRPGRFDRIVNIPLPDKNSRKDILKLYLKDKNTDKNIKIDFLSELTTGFSGAQIKNLINEASINAARLGNIIITEKNIEDALDKILVGIIKKNDMRTIDSKTRVAIHEIGHAFLAAYFKNYFKLHKVTIQPTYNGIGGYTLFNEYDNIREDGLYTKDILKKKLIIVLGGKAAEEAFYFNNYVSLGASEDLKEANRISRKMINNYGMGNELKVFYNENLENTYKYSEKIKEKIDEESLFLINEAYSEALKLINNNKNKISELVKLLLEKTVLDGEFIYNYSNLEYPNLESS